MTRERSFNTSTNANLKPNQTMNFIPAYLYAWHRHIRYMLERTPTPSSSETKRPLTFNYELYGRYLQARQDLLNQI